MVEARPYTYGSINEHFDADEQQRRHEQSVISDRFEHIRISYKLVFLSISIFLLIVTTGKRHWVAKPEQDLANLAVDVGGSHPPAPFSLTFLGDEVLLGHPEREHQLTARLGVRVYHEIGLKLNSHVHAKYRGVAEMAADIDNVFTSDHPADGIVLMLHNDLAQYRGVDDSSENEERARVATLRFQSNLNSILHTLNTTWPETRVCLCGPGLVGEHGPLFKPSWATPLMQRKANEMREILLSVHRAYPEVYFLDLQHALRDSLPIIWPFWAGWLTHQDGQTLNERGTNVEVRLLGELMLRYYQESEFQMLTGSTEIEDEPEIETDTQLVDDLQ